MLHRLIAVGFDNADFGAADFSGASLNGVQIRNADLSNTVGLNTAWLIDTDWDEYTLWPAGFVPPRSMSDPGGDPAEYRKSPDTESFV